MWREKELCIIKDAYCTEHDIQLKKQEYSFIEAFSELKDTCVCDNTISISGEGVNNILCCYADISGIKYEYLNGTLSLTGSLDVSMIIRDNGDSLSNVNKSFDFRYEKSMDLHSDSVFCEPEINVMSVKCNVRNGNIADVRTEMAVSGYVISRCSIECVTGISVSDTPVKHRKASVTVYFPDCENESLWNIARRYNTTVSAIAEENGLSGETTEKLGIVFIPCS